MGLLYIAQAIVLLAIRLKTLCIGVCFAAHVFSLQKSRRDQISLSCYSRQNSKYGRFHFRNENGAICLFYAQGFLLKTILMCRSMSLLC